MRPCFGILTILYVAVVGCGRTRPILVPLPGADARPDVEPGATVDASKTEDTSPAADMAGPGADANPDLALVEGPDAAFAYPAVDDGTGGKAIDPAYVFRNFNSLLEGTWQIGWYGGQNHFSYIRFAPTGGKLFDNPVQVLSSVDAPHTLPYWECSGAGTWNSLERPAAVDLTLPAGCEREILIFETFHLSLKSDAEIAQVGISACRGTQCAGSGRTQLVGLKIPDDRCNAAFTACGTFP